MSNRAIAQALAAGRVPNDVDRAKLYESTDNQTIAAIIFVGSFTTILVLVRLASRVLIVKRFGIDDALALFGLITLIAFIVLCVILIRMGSGRHFVYVQYVMTLQTVENSEIIDFAAHLIYTSSLLIGRLSGLAFYYRLCKMHNIFRLAIFVVAGIIGAGFLPQIFLIIFHCVPVTGLWPYEWQPGVDKYTCLEWGLVYSVNSATSLLCDFLIFGIPIAMLRALDMSRKRKIQLTFIKTPPKHQYHLCLHQLTGHPTRVICISITRLVFVIKGQWEADMSWSYNPMLGIEVSEIGGTLIALSVPGIKPVFDLMFGKLRDASKESYGSARSRFHPHSQHLSSTENLKESHLHRSRRGATQSSVAGGCHRDFELESTGSARMGHGAGVVAAKKESISTVGSGDENSLRPGSDAILVQVAFGIDEERGSPIPKNYGLKHFSKDGEV
ncbi:hypothetical protein TD95_001185 [Thielaviopsis punctulata]|uniref:Rhodopsin domain-containing protein n=1 Tax=Thielaviopsis punctulata TaxID=72032 RepID=A0A0F4ZK01_9PEZI|nr:hypothetical protein TD95_001185 [Thielaviopsis punctulata]